jgi:hypothetical protein
MKRTSTTSPVNETPRANASVAPPASLREAMVAPRSRGPSVCVADRKTAVEAITANASAPAVATTATRRRRSFSNSALNDLIIGLLRS